MDRILLVDDDALVLQALGRVLGSAGYEVVTHQEPERALDEREFSVVITDFMMPTMNGIQLLSELRRHNPDAVRVMLTAAADFQTASEAVNRGEVFRLLAKPWTISELTQCVSQAVTQYHLVEENRRLSRELAQTNAELLAINQNLERIVVERTNGLLDGLVSALDMRDTETQWHSRRVALFARRIGEAFGLTSRDLDVIEQGALLHDIGKIGVRDSILLKPGQLTPQEWGEMRLHPEIGHRMLSRLSYLHEAAAIVYQHQERWDGHGYPQGLRHEEIVLGARVFSIADAFDAITSDRPYRKGRSIQNARQEIQRCSGSQFDPRLVDVFLTIPEHEWERIRGRIELFEADGLRSEALNPRASARPLPGAQRTFKV